MANFQIGDSVYVPAQRVDKTVDTPFAIVKGTVKSIPDGGRSVSLDLPYGLGNRTVASSICHKEVGVLIVKIGDFETEPGLLNPLAVSLDRYCRLLLPGDQLKTIHLRTKDELAWVIRTHHATYSHWILIGHGGSGSLLFANNSTMSSADFCLLLENTSAEAKFILSLCCHTGESAFAKKVSQSNSCRVFLGPKGPLHGASACQFAQSYLAYHFLEGRTTKVAFNQTREQTPGGAVFRLWQNGAFTGAR